MSMAKRISAGRQKGGAVSMKMRSRNRSKYPCSRLSQNDGLSRFRSANQAPPRWVKTKRSFGNRSIVPLSMSRTMLMVLSMARPRFRVRLNASMPWGRATGNSDEGCTKMGMSRSETSR